jgi:hypothetical protein
MAPRSEAAVVYAAGAVQGIVLVAIRAASTIFTDPTRYGLSSTQYGTMFVPRIVTPVGASLLGAGLSRRFGAKRVYLGGLGCGLVSMGLLILSQFFMSQRPVAYGPLLLSTAALGAGFRLTVRCSTDAHPQASPTPWSSQDGRTSPRTQS